MGFDFGKKLAIPASFVAGITIVQAPVQAVTIISEDFEDSILPD